MRNLIIAAALIALPLPSLNAAEIEWHDAASVARAAVASSPSIARAAAAVTVARERVGSAGSLPNPMAMGGVRDLQVDLSNDEMMTMYMVGASQTLVRPSKLKLRRGAAELEVDQAVAELDSVRAETEREALFRYYEIAALDSQIAATSGVAKLADVLIDSTRVRYETGGAIQADIIRAQLARTNIAHELLQLRTRRKVAAAQLASLLGLDSAQIPELTIHHEMPVTAPEPTPRYDEENPAIAALAAERDRQGKLIDLAKTARTPDLDLEASYGVRPQQTDMFSLVARVEIPFRRRDLIEPRVREAIARREAAAFQIEARRRALESDAAVAAAFHDEAEEQVRLHEQVLVPQSKLAFEAVLAAYQTGKGNFEAVLSATNSYLRLEIDYYGFLAQHLKSTADLEALRRGARFGATSGAKVVGGADASFPRDGSSSAMGSM